MTTITIDPQDASRPAAAPSKPGEFFVTAADGRVIKLKKPNPLSRLDFAEASGSDKVNLSYLSEVHHLQFVAAIDDVAVATPSNRAELRHLYNRLGEDGNAAAAAGVAQHFFAVVTANAQEAELKNS